MYQPSKVLLSPGAKGQLASIGITNCMYTNHHGLLLLCVHGLCIDSSENDSDITSSPDCLSDEGNEDEGIGRNIRQPRGNFKCRHQDCMYAVSYTHLTLPTIYSV